MSGGNRGGLSAAVCAGVIALVAVAGCGGSDDESTAKNEPVDVSAAGEPAETFIERMTKLLETSADKKDCAELEAVNARSVTRFPCPVPKTLRESMARFELVGAKEYGTGAVIDYKSGKLQDGAAITLFVSPNRNWGIGRFGVVSKPSTETSDTKSRKGYAAAADEFLASIRERDCDAYFAVTYNGNDKKGAVCKRTFPSTKSLAKLMKDNPDAKLTYEGGNETFGFYSLEVKKPQPKNLTISIVKSSSKSPRRPYVILDVTTSPTTAQQKQAEKTFEQEQQKKNPNQDMTPSSKPVDS